MNQQHINELQTPNSFGTYVKQYIENSVAPLANAGQRFGINANGIKYKQKTCADIFNLNYVDNKENYLLEIHFENNTLNNIQLVNKNNNVSVLDINKTFINELLFSNISDNNIANLLKYSFTDITEISEDSFCTVNNNLLTGFIKGKLNNEITSICDSKIMYFQYDVNSNILQHQIETKYYGKININGVDTDDWFIVYQLDLKENNNNNLIYNLRIYLYRLEWLSNYISELYNTTNKQDINNSILNYYKFDFVNNSDGLDLFTIFNKNFENYDYFTYNGPVLSYISFLNFVFLYDNTLLSEKNFISDKYTINVNNNIVDNNDFNNIINNSIFSGYISKSNLSLYFINLQKLDNLYKQLYIYYNQITFFNNNDNEYLYKYIIYKLYTYLNNELGNTNNIIYIPLTYTFNCFISDINDSLLYFINDIYVKFLNNYQDINFTKNYIYYLNSDFVDHVSIYQIHINYNDELTNSINNVTINKLYTLPYINKLNNWVIDDIDSSNTISQNQYTGIKELFIYSSLTDNKISANILNISDTSIIKYFNFKEHNFTVNNKYFLKYNNLSVTCKALIPDLKDASNNVIEFFKNTIIISISDKKLLGEYQDDYAYDFVYSLWNYDEVNNKFILISFDNNYAFDPYNNMSVINREQTYKYVQSLLADKVIDSNTTNIIMDNNYLTLRNKNGLDYNSKYNNNYNTIIEYVSNVNENGNNPNYNVNKFITKLSDIPITNNLYPKYKYITRIDYIEQINDIPKTINVYNTKTYMSVIINNQNKLTIEFSSQESIKQIYDTIKNISLKENEVYIGISQNTNSVYDNFDEYIFDTNIPTIDLKEMFVRNTNTINRVNILGLMSDNETKIYNGFIGTKYDNANKDTLYLSTSNTNINIGNDTLLYYGQNDQFNKYKTFQIDEFENINLYANNKLNIKVNNNHNTSINLDDDITINGNNISLNSNNNINLNNKTNIQYSLTTINKLNDDILTYHTSIIPHGFYNNNIYIKYNFQNNNLLNIDIQELNLENIKNTLFIPIFGCEITQNQTNNKIYEYFYNSINLSVLLTNIFGDIYTNNTFTYICNNNNKILDIQDYKLLIFNDNHINTSNRTNLYNKFTLINYQLNITLVLNTSSNENIIYVNFENTNIDTLNKQLPENPNNGSLYQILNMFNDIYTNQTTTTITNIISQ